MTPVPGNAPPEVKGWCPGALRPMQSGDGWVVRLRPICGRLTPAQAQGIARVAQDHGNGLIDLSSRGNVQIRGVTPDGHAPMIDDLRSLGLIDADPSAEARRNILVAPLWEPGDGTTAICRALSDLLAAPDAPDLPGKFGFALDSGPVPVLSGGGLADVVITRAGSGFVVHAGGAPTGAPAGPQDAAIIALGLARWFLATGGMAGGRGRMAAHLPRAALPQAFRTTPVPAHAPQPMPGLVAQGALVGLAFGQMTAATLAALADLGPLRATPWRMLLVEGAGTMPDMPGLITRGEDPLCRVVACTGAPGCSQALGPTRPLAQDLAAAVPPGQVLHVAGCTKGCARPGPADLTLVATGAGYALIRGGTAADAPEAVLAPATLRALLSGEAHAPYL